MTALRQLITGNATADSRSQKNWQRTTSAPLSTDSCIYLQLEEPEAYVELIVEFLEVKCGEIMSSSVFLFLNAYKQKPRTLIAI